MSDLPHKFSKAAKAVLSGKTSMWESVNGAYVDHLSDIRTDSFQDEGT